MQGPPPCILRDLHGVWLSISSKQEETEVDDLYLEDGYGEVRRCENDMAADTALHFFSFIACYSLKESRIRFIFILLWNTDHLAYNLELTIGNYAKYLESPWYKFLLKT